MHEDPVDKPPLNEDTLAHYGVMGMKWGKHKREDTSGKSSSGAKPVAKSTKPAAKSSDDAYALAQQYLAASKKGPKVSEKEALANLKTNQQKFHDKFEPSVAKDNSPHKELTPEQQKARDNLKKVAIGAAVVGGIVALSYLSKQSKGGSQLTSFAEEYAAKGTAMKDLAGQPVSLKQYSKAVSHSKGVSWGYGKYIQESSFKNEGFTLPAGHTFHRISTKAEDSFKDGGTYATHSIEDFNRYVGIFRHEKLGANLHHVNFSTKTEFRVPSLVDTLETMKETLAERYGEHPDNVSQESVLMTYHNLSGGSWSNDDPVTKSFFANLAKKGYHAIVDEMDAGVIGEAPLVIFAHDNLTEKVTQPLTKDAIKAAEAALVEIGNRKL